MQSRACVLIQRDLHQLAKQPVNGVDLVPIVNDDYFDLAFYFHPTDHSPWCGCLFRLCCTFPETFNIQSPVLRFDPLHIPYHPNVEPLTGRVRLSSNEKWSSRSTLRSLLDELARAFVVPNEKIVVNADAMRLLKYRPDEYRAIIAESLTKSRQLMDTIDEQRAERHSPYGMRLVEKNGRQRSSVTCPISLVVLRRSSTFTRVRCERAMSTVASLGAPTSLVRRVPEHLERYRNVEIDAARRESSTQSVDSAIALARATFSVECQ